MRMMRIGGNYNYISGPGRGCSIGTEVDDTHRGEGWFKTTIIIVRNIVPMNVKDHNDDHYDGNDDVVLGRSRVLASLPEACC